MYTVPFRTLPLEYYRDVPPPHVINRLHILLVVAVVTVGYVLCVYVFVLRHLRFSTRFSKMVEWYAVAHLIWERIRRLPGCSESS